VLQEATVTMLVVTDSSSSITGEAHSGLHTGLWQ